MAECKYDWKAAHAAFKTSKLSKAEFFRTRLSEFGTGPLPCIYTCFKHFRALDLQNENAQVHELGPDLQIAYLKPAQDVAPATSPAKPTDSSVLFHLYLPCGVNAEFLTTHPEELALSMVQRCIGS